MPPQGRLRDKAQAPLDAHGCPACPHPVIGPAIEGSPNVMVNRLPAVRCDDKGIHAACCGPNTWTAYFGSDKVFINGKGAHRQDDLTKHCGGMGKLTEGSPNVIVGGNSVPCPCSPADNPPAPVTPPAPPPDSPPDNPDDPPDTPPDTPPDNPDDPPDTPPDNPDDPPDTPPDNPDDPPDTPPDNPDDPPDTPPDNPDDPPDTPPDNPPVKTGWLDVIVIDGGGTPVRGAQVRLEGATSATGQTDDLGMVRLPDLTPGRYQVKVGAEQASEAAFPVDVTAGTPPGPAPAVVPPPVASMPLPPEQELFARPSDGDSNSGGDASSRSNLVGSPPGGAGDAATGDAPSGSGAPVTGPVSSGSQVGPNQAVAVMWKGWELVLHEHPTDLTDGAREGKGAGGAAAWKPSSVAASFNYQPNVLPPLGDAVSVPYKMPVLLHPSRAPSGVSGLIGVTHPDVNNTFTVRREGPHKAPIIWVMDKTDPVKSDAPTPVERKLMGRARFSLYAGPDVVSDDNLKSGVVDDLSLLITVQNDESSMTPVFDIGIKESKGVAAAPKFFQGVIARCHDKMNVQVLAGYGLVDRGEKRIRQFDVWLDQMSEKEQGAADGEIDAYAQRVITFLDTEVGTGSLRFDGISFDIESCGLFGGPLAGGKNKPPMSQDKLDRLRRVLRRFYKTTADLLAVDNRICAVTVGGMMSDDAAVVSGKLASVPVSSGTAMLAAKLHVYDIGKEAPNIIIRPMAYDNAGGTHETEPPPDQKALGASKEKIPAFNSDPGQLEWHEAITKFALEEKKLHPAQFQLAMKHFTPQKTIELPDKTKGPPFSTGQGGNVPTSGRQDARATLLRKYRAGLILFAMGKEENWARNERLNGILNAGFDGKPLPTNREGQPLQVPLDAAGVAALSKGSK